VFACPPRARGRPSAHGVCHATPVCVPRARPFRTHHTHHVRLARHGGRQRLRLHARAFGLLLLLTVWLRLWLRRHPCLRHAAGNRGRHRSCRAGQHARPQRRARRPISRTALLHPAGSHRRACVCRLARVLPRVGLGLGRARRVVRFRLGRTLALTTAAPHGARNALSLARPSIWRGRQFPLPIRCRTVLTLLDAHAAFSMLLLGIGD
jgi:hypothetical protein